MINIFSDKNLDLQLLLLKIVGIIFGTLMMLGLIGKILHELGYCGCGG